ncbi:MAG TPA: NAD(P)/FAD-dependent oxidoreductase [Polyangia bacterium]|jgi:phytoene dehydrogenase-like protein
MLDAIVVGAGPNGLSAAITLAWAGHSVLVLEANESIGGGVRSAALTLPGFVHDVCAGSFPMALGSPFFRALPLEAHGLSWIHPVVPLAHPLDDGRAVVLHRSLEETMLGLDEDGAAHARMFGDLTARWQALLPADHADGPPAIWRQASSRGRVLRPSPSLLRTLVTALRPANSLARGTFRTEEARALLAGLAAHGMQPLTKLGTGAFALTLGAAAHAVGWPLVRGGAQRLTDALAAILRGHGGVIETGRRVGTLAELPPSRVVLLDVSPAALRRLAADRLSPGYRRWLARFRRGPAAFKLDYALSAPIPWTASACRRAGVVHVGGTLEEIGVALADTWQGLPSQRPFVLVAQPSLFDRDRVPAGTDSHTAWAYCHVPRGDTIDMTDAIEQQIERFAPGFKQTVLARHVLDPAALEAHDVNLERGDIAGGACDLRQLLFRPAPRIVPWTTSDPRLFLCSASTPPGPGVHGLCGHFAALAALRTLRRRGRDDLGSRVPCGRAPPFPG